MKKLVILIGIFLITALTTFGQQKFFGIDFISNSAWDAAATLTYDLPLTVKSCYTTYYQFDVSAIDTIVGYGASMTVQGSLNGDFYQNTGMSFTIDSAARDTILVDTLCYPKVRVVLDTANVTAGTVTMYIWMLRTD